MSKNYNFIDLFCGLGSYHLALEKYGKCVLACDIDSKVKEVYKMNFGMEVFHDVKFINKEIIKRKVDIVTAGSPCQSMSTAGLRGGLDDPRGMLFFETIRIAKLTNCKYIFQENVRGLLSIDNGKTIKCILDKIEQIGYKTIVIQASPHEFCDIPQRRERIFMFSIRKDLWDDDKVRNFISSIEKMRNLNRTYKKIILNKSEVKHLNTSIPSNLEQSIVAWQELLNKLCSQGNIEIDTNKFYLPYMLKTEKPRKYELNIYNGNVKFYKQYKSIIDNYIKKHPIFQSDFNTYRRIRVLSNQTCKLGDSNIQYRQSGLTQISNIFPTVPKSNYNIIITKQRRLISVEEIRKLQGFPKSYKYVDENSFKQQLGNSINNKLLKILVDQFFKHIVN